MIVSNGPAPARRADGSGPERHLRCLARRGMLHSECQAVDHLRLATGDHLDLTEAAGHETAWVICRGRARVSGASGDLAAGDVVLVPDGARPRLTVVSGPLEVLRVAVLAGETARLLPPRRPVA
ncbi:hypothetical protein O7634_28820 [Micromonospora sp. WMMD1120]|uniref:hypothetical protein n=1 Tax=Micromonospora sp. WMMD1120 TaxID=3016106 RepID=UPI002416746F|nr:hypothetical protein [Micromonospora sp. WMMD1120]MDG4810778.1 hypothetical protein [Micromonospora sp. WMMD1120]